MYFSRLLPSGLGGRYLFSFLPCRAEKIVWQNDEKKEFKVWKRGTHYAARVPIETPGGLLWLKASRRIEQAVSKWATPIHPRTVMKASLNDVSYFVLLLPVEMRERMFQGQRLVWGPRNLGKLLSELEVAFQDLIETHGTWVKIGQDKQGQIVEGFRILDEKDKNEEKATANRTVSF